MKETKILIKSVKLKNFMCHKNFKIDFSKPITCIGGVNGSGKSAVMIALGILFGKTAASMERGNSYRSLIRSETQMAVIEATLNNYLNLKSSFYQVPYGDEITIIKQLHFKGTTDIKVIIEGKAKRLKKYEMDNIMFEYGLNLANPLNFLTQEESKKILNVKKTSDLYDFFYVGTEFKKLDEDIRICGIETKEMISKITETKNKQVILSKQLEVLNKNIDFMNQDYESLLEQVHKEEQWHLIFEMENEKKELETKLDRYQAEENILINKIDKISKEQTPQQKLADLTEINNKIDKVEVDYEKLTKDYKDIVNQYEEKKIQLEKVRQRSNKKQLEEEFDELTFSINEAKNKIKEFEKQNDDLNEMVYEENLNNQNVSKASDSIRRELHLIANNNSNNPALDKVLKSFNLINEEIKRMSFKDEVIGPIVDYIELKEQKWYKAISGCLSKSLNNYIVFNIDDREKLNQLFKEKKLQFPILLLQSKNKFKNLREPSSQYKTVYSVLKINKDPIVNALITYHNIEQIILIEDRQEAYKVIESQPTNVDCAFILTGDRIKMIGKYLSDNRDREMGFYYFEDSKSREKDLKNQLSNLKTKNEYTNLRKELENEIRNYRNVVRNCENELKRVTPELDSFKIVRDEDLDMMERKMQIINKQKTNMKSKKEILHQNLIDLKNEKSKIESQNDQINDQISNYFKVKNQMINDVRVEMRMIEENKRIDQIALEAKKTKIEIKSKELGARANFRSKDKLMEDKIFLKQKIMEVKELGNKDLMIQNKEKLTEEILLLTDNINSFDNLLNVTLNTINMREEKRNEIINVKTKEAIREFNIQTNKSGYDGSLEFDHVNKLLDLKMRVHNSSILGNKNTLSGGERSFASVCFLLSLWKSFVCPVKVLDEFDVFMDPLNRKNAIKALFDFVK
ncbi:SMC6 [Hepatospora eriocheir]|uniref:SMC6 n=1 Tax=Hepatospora eriocheir TaxID=1081669 RepID=A0A1X0QCK2_9MICR|nr:SMC6 [Hepatospora eriocheir]